MRTEGLQARADIEAAVETSPVGVVVFDARTGRPFSLNRDAKRIVESLRMPGHPPEALLEMITCRLGDGHEILLDRFPLVWCLTNTLTNLRVLLAVGCVRHPGLDPGSSSRGARH